jgi:hypothetical protein
VRVLLAVAALAAVALSGCMMDPEARSQDFEAWDHGRGLAFFVLLFGMLVAGGVVLLVNLTQSHRPPPPTPSEAKEPEWLPVEETPEPPAAKPRPAAKPAPKASSKQPRRGTR